MIRTDSHPNAANRARNALVFASSSLAASMTTSLPSACLAESAVLRPSRRTFFCRSKAWLRTTGPKITAPPRNCGERRLPWRARPVPFCLYGFFEVPLISLMPLVLWVPARRLASCQATTRARMSRRTGSPKMSSASSMSPTSSLSRFRTESFISRLRRRGFFGGRGRAVRAAQRRRERQSLGRLALGGVPDEDPAAGTARHRAAQHQDAALGVGPDHFKALHGHP